MADVVLETANAITHPGKEIAYSARDFVIKPQNWLINK